MKEVLISLLLISGACFATDATESFPGLNELELHDGYVEKIRVLYNSNLTDVINRKIEFKEDGMEITRAIRTKINYREGESFIVDYDEGASNDPHFTIYKESNNTLTKIISINGTEIVVPGNGSVYVSGHTNSMFNKRRKYVLKGASIVEVKQPYYYVGVRSIVNENVTLYASEEMRDEVAKLPAGSNVEILLNNGRNYLIKTPFGLTGWYRIKNEYPVGPHEKVELEGIYFNGD